MEPSCICGHPKNIHGHYTLERYCAARECACNFYRKPGFLRRWLRVFTGR